MAFLPFILIKRPHPEEHLDVLVGVHSLALEHIRVCTLAFALARTLEFSDLFLGGAKGRLPYVLGLVHHV